LNYSVTWSEEDKEWVGLCDEFPSLSWLDGTPEYALAGIQKLVADIEYEAPYPETSTDTGHLLRSPENAKRLLTALNRAYENSVQPSSLEELREETHLPENDDQIEWF